MTLDETIKEVEEIYKARQIAQIAIAYDEFARRAIDFLDKPKDSLKKIGENQDVMEAYNTVMILGGKNIVKYLAIQDRPKSKYLVDALKECEEKYQAQRMVKEDIFSDSEAKNIANFAICYDHLTDLSEYFRNLSPTKMQTREEVAEEIKSLYDSLTYLTNDKIVTELKYLSGEIFTGLEEVVKECSEIVRLKEEEETAEIEEEKRETEEEVKIKC